ncbi:hypothetical protein KD930_gp59 [Mycobacterium phage Kevin1]|uniref:Uncharacterized protein n=1 Tax=Mycobacterium phage Kevin1 TaxID=2530132 RepID=A0A481VUG7_9CAUD|nr:hypothetical protein KD930_gp59 [Mycobacterium phage Kevin1]QBI97303.1 hypothetical protein SEA_KEVIN1_59 [Mycobacterium phage Kevin1]
MSFEARYPGACAYGDRITPGDLCTYTDDDEIAHVECKALDGAANVHASNACPTRQLDHAGECF